MKWPSVSFAIATRNSGRTLSECLSSIKDQLYPSSVEIVIADGGSSDNTFEIIKKYNTKLIKVDESKQNAEYNKGVAVDACKNELIILVDHDNILPHNHWIRNMVRPLVEDEEIFGCGVFQFGYDRNMTALDRYFALLGATDPIPFFFNKSGHQSWIYKEFHLRGTLLKESKNYYKVELNPDKMPALGANGSVIRNNLIKSLKLTPNLFFHIDVHADLAKKGYVKYAFVKDTIIHLSNNNIISFLRRRRYFMEKYHFTDRSKRRYSIYEHDKDKFLLLGYILYSLSIVLPLIDSIRGYLRVKDIAWFIHPIMCLCILFLYGITYLREWIKRYVFLER